MEQYGQRSPLMAALDESLVVRLVLHFPMKLKTHCILVVDSLEQLELRNGTPPVVDWASRTCTEHCYTFPPRCPSFPVLFPLKKKKK